MYGEDGKPTYSDHLRQRFLREAKLLSELQDRHTIRLYDYGKSQDGLLFMIFEFIDGAPLSDLIGPKMPATRVVSVLKQVLSSLHEAHQHGIIHRDIKPANIMIYEYLGQTDCAKLLDFGVAKDVDATMQLTTRNMRIGTMRYMSPEQVRGDEVVPASDLYSLGLVAYEMLVGSKAIESDDMNVVSLFHMRPDAIALPNVDVSPDLRAIVERMMAKSLAHRFETAADVLLALSVARLNVSADNDLDDPPTLRAFSPDDH